MSAWWRGNRKCILGNQQKVVCPILNLPIKSSRHFQWWLSYFHGHLTWLCCWHGFLMSLFTGSAIWLTNKFWKWTEMYGLKMCLRNPSRTRRFQYHIRVLFVHVVVYSPGMQMRCHGPTYENSRWRLRPEVVTTYLWNSDVYTYIFGGARFKGCMTDANT